MDPRRRFLLQAGLAVPAAMLLGAAGARARAAPTPACGDALGAALGREGPTPSQTAGPFYTPDVPAKRDFRADDPAGRPLDLRATVLDTQCRPVAGALVDLWHADSQGRYDNDGFRLRGHQRADALGAVRFETVRPGHYPGRTPHFHVRIFGAGGGRLLTTQLYFPDEAANADDGLFKRELLLQVATAGGTLDARFAFIVQT